MATEIRSAALGGSLIHRIFRITFEDLVEADTSETESVVTLPDNVELEHAFYDLVEVFACPSMTGLTAALGTSADVDAFQQATELISGPPSTGRKNTKGVWRTGDGAALQVVFTATGANFGDGDETACTAGILDVHLVYREI